MNQKNLVIAVIVLLVMNVVTVIGWSKSMNQVDEYHYYYKSTEALLDTLENEYNWIDAIDNYEYYDAVDRLKKN